MDWTLEQLGSVDVKKGKMRTLYRILRPGAEIDRLYMKREGGGRGLLNVEETGLVEKINSSKYVRDSGEQLTHEVVNGDVLSGCGDPEVAKAELGQNKKDAFKDKKLLII